MGKRYKKEFLQRRHTDGQETYEKMFNITNHQGNANQNHNKASPHTSQNGCYWMWTKGNPSTLLARDCTLVQPLWKAVWRFLTKLKIDLPHDPVILPLGMYQKITKTLIWKDICTPMKDICTPICTLYAALFTIAKI